MAGIHHVGPEIDLVPQRYEIVGKLGSGGMGEVYSAHDHLLGRDVAIKVILRGGSANPRRDERFLREARAAAALEHPNILTIHDVGEHNGRPFIVTELLEGSVLRDEIGRLSVFQALRYAIQIADGLGAAHAKGIVHRDLKPENIFITGEGRVKILDFGLARIRSEEAGSADNAGAETEATLTSDGEVMGTTGYMAPEQVCGRPVDRRADVFVFGCVLYEMLSGRHPFRQASSAETGSAILRDDPVPVEQINPLVSPALASIVDRCLQKKVGERYDSTRDLHRALESISRSASGVLSTNTGRRHTVPWGNRRVTLAAGAALMLAVTLFGAVALWRSGGSRDDSVIPPFQPKRVTSNPGPESDPAVSPDGNDVAFSLRRGAASDIWLIDANGGTPLQLTNDSAKDTNPAWFPDGDSIAFARIEGDRASIYRTLRFGGGAVLMVENGTYPAVSPDGERIAFSRADEGGFYRIWVARLDAMEQARKITGEESGLWDHVQPAWSPDGSTICYGDFRNLWSIPADGGAPTPITDDDAVDKRCAWSPDGRYVYFASHRDGVWAIWRRSFSKGVMSRVTLGTGADVSPSLSRDGGRLVYSRRIKGYAISLLDTDTGTRSSVRQTLFMNSPTIAPDRSAVVYNSMKENVISLWRLRLADNSPEGEPQRLTRQPGSCANPQFSPDGRWIAYHGVIDGQRDIWVVPSIGGSPAKLTSDEAVDVQPAWSPDGTRIAFSSDRSGSLEIWTAKISDGRLTGRPRQITSTDGFVANPCWCRDSKELAFLLMGEKGADVYVVEAEGSDKPRRLTDGADATTLAWDHRSGELLVQGLWGGRFYEVRAIDPSTGAETPRPEIAPLSPSANMGPFEVSIDGRLVAWSEEEDYGDLWILDAEQWRF